MAALQCDICGGKLIGKPNGIFECDSCGMEYSTEWAKAKIQEIKGTVKVEGTVQVAGTVKVDGPVQVKGGVNIESLLQRGQMALEDGKWEEARKFFDRALNMDAKRSDAHWGLLCAKYEQPDFSSLLKEKYEIIREDKDYQRALNLSEDEVKDRAISRELEFQKALSDAKIRFERKCLELASIRKRIRPARQLLAIVNNMIFGVMTDGTVRMCGVPGYNEKKIVEEVPSWREICAICALPNKDTLFGLKYDGTIVAAGRKTYREDVTKWTDIAAIYPSSWDLVGLKKDGTVVVSGNYPAISDWKNIVEIESDRNHIYGVQADGRIVVASSEYEEENEVTFWCNIVGLEFGRVGLKADGTITKTCQMLDKGCEDWEDVVALFRDGVASVYGLRKDGSVLHGDGDFGEYRDVVAIIDEHYCKILLKADGTIDFLYSYDSLGSYTMTESDKKQIIRQMSVVSSWKLFDHIDTLEQERQVAREQLRQTEERRAEAARRAAEEARKHREERKATLNAEMEQLNTEFFGLKGLFTRKRRQEINARLAEIEAELKELN